MVRKACENDLPRIAEIIIFGKRSAYRPIFQNDRFSFNELTVVGLYNELISDSKRWENMLVYDDGIIKGVINCVFDPSRGSAEVCEFYAEPFFKGQGVGRALIGVFFEQARLRGCSLAELWVIKDNLDARRFYEWNGFAPTGLERPIEGADKIDFHMKMEI